MQAARPRTIAKTHPQMWYFLWEPLSLQVLLIIPPSTAIGLIKELLNLVYPSMHDS